MTKVKFDFALLPRTLKRRIDLLEKQLIEAQAQIKDIYGDIKLLNTGFKENNKWLQRFVEQKADEIAKALEPFVKNLGREFINAFASNQTAMNALIAYLTKLTAIPSKGEQDHMAEGMRE
jgi:hypothetical protein